MSKLLQVTDNLALAFGFSWAVLDPLQPRGEKLSELLAQGHRWQAQFKLAGNEHLGVSRDDFTPQPKIKTMSGAALMAKHPRLQGKTVWIVMEEPGPDYSEVRLENAPRSSENSLIVVVGLLNGNIVIDDYVDKAGYDQHWAAFQGRCKKAESKATTAGTSYNLGRLAQEFTWDDFLPTRVNKAVPVRPLEPSLNGKVITIVAVCAVVVAAGWGYVRWNDAREAAAARERSAQAARNVPAMYTASVDEILSKPVWRANRAFSELRAKLYTFPLKHAGWGLNKIECHVSSGCVATWDNRNKVGTNRGFAAAAPSSWGVISFSRTGEEATHVVPVTLGTAPLPARESWPVGREFLLKQFSQWQSYWIVGFRPVLAARANIVGLVAGLDEETAATFPDATWATPWTIEKTDWDLSEGFDLASEKGDGNLPDSVTVDSITVLVDQNNEVKFDARGLIYERQ